MDVLSPVQSNELGKARLLFLMVLMNFSQRLIYSIGNNELASPIFNKATTRPPLENVNVHFYPLAPAKLQKVLIEIACVNIPLQCIIDCAKETFTLKSKQIKCIKYAI